MSKVSLSRAWEETSAVLARDGRLFVPVALALLVLPGLVVDVALPDARPGEFPPAGPWMIVAFLMLMVSLVGQLAVIRLAIEPPVTVGEAIKHGARRLAVYVASTIIWLVPILLLCSALYGYLAANPANPSVPAALALIALCLVFAFVAVRLMLSSAVASGEHVGPLAVMKRSWQLSRGTWWRLFAFLLLFGVGALCLIWAVDSVTAVLVRLVVDNAGPRSIGGLIISIVSQLVSASMSVVLFVMLARIYVQRAGTGAVQASVPSSGI